MNRLSRNLMIIYRTERLIARRQMNILRQQTGLMLFAGLVTGIGVIMLNVAAFFALSAVMANYAAATAVAVVNLFIALALVGWASRLNADKELEPAVEVRDLALAELEADLEQVSNDAKELTRNVGRIARDPLGTALPALLGPLITILVNSTKKK